VGGLIAIVLVLAGCGGLGSSSREPGIARSWVADLNAGQWTRACGLINREGRRQVAPALACAAALERLFAHRRVVFAGNSTVSAGWTSYAPLSTDSTRPPATQSSSLPAFNFRTADGLVGFATLNHFDGALRIGFWTGYLSRDGQPLLTGVSAASPGAR
jgi:hypothetical protein